MRTPFLFMAPILAVLLLAQPAFAISYSSSAILDFGTLMIGGISISPGNEFSQVREQRQFAGVNDSERFSTNNSWVSNTVIQDMPNVGSARSILEPSLIQSSASLTGRGTVGADTTRQFFFIANEPGDLTVSINYTLSQVGVLDPKIEPLLNGVAFVDISLFPFTSPFVSDSAVLTTIDSVLGDGSKTGTLSFTGHFSPERVDQGVSAILTMRATSRAERVPVPDMLWPTVIGMIGLVGLVMWRKAFPV